MIVRAQGNKDLNLREWIIFGCDRRDPEGVIVNVNLNGHF